jgi:hypothetical protein
MCFGFAFNTFFDLGKKSIHALYKYNALDANVHRYATLEENVP